MMLFLALSLSACTGPTPPTTAAPDVPAEVTTMPEPAPPPAAPESLGDDFTGALYQQLAATDGNVFASPTSIQLALGMTMAGAVGETRDEMARALSLPEDPHPLLGARQESWNAYDGPGELAVANRVWVADDLSLADTYEATIEKHYGAAIVPENFGDGEGARGRINGWVEEQTRDRIQDLIPPGTLNAGTSMVLTNAIYFLGKWEVAFDAAQTVTAPFHKADGSTTEVPLMSRTGQVAYAVKDGVQAIRLPYRGERFAFIALLPPTDVPLSTVESTLVEHGVSHYLGGLSTQKVRVLLPRFELKTSYELVPPMQELGMRLAFGGSADFSGMGPAGQSISAIVHKAFVKVDEEGTEAAAATGVIMTRSMPAPVPVFRADRPFVFAIWDAEAETTLFVGRLSEP